MLDNIKRNDLLNCCLVKKAKECHQTFATSIDNVTDNIQGSTNQGVHSFFRTKYQDNIKNIKTNFIEISRHFSYVSQFSHDFLV